MGDEQQADAVLRSLVALEQRLGAVPG